MMVIIKTALIRLDNLSFLKHISLRTKTRYRLFKSLGNRLCFSGNHIGLYHLETFLNLKCPLNDTFIYLVQFQSRLKIIPECNIMCVFLSLAHHVVTRGILQILLDLQTYIHTQFSHYSNTNEYISSNIHFIYIFTNGESL